MSSSDRPATKHQFGPFTLDIDRGALLRDGVEVPLRPQSFQVLEMLVQRHGTLVTKEALHETVWAGRAVTDDSLTQCLIDIRKALGDSDRTLVRTVPRRGYLFAGEISTGSAEQQIGRPFPIRQAALAALLVAAVAVLGWLFSGSGSDDPDPASIAVLPFADMSADGNWQYLGDGLSEDLLNALAQQTGLQVIARTSSFAFASNGADIETIRRQLNVAYVLEGSVRDQGEMVRVTAQLIATDDASHRWSQVFDSDPSQLATVQNRIAREVVSRILPDADSVADVRPTQVFSSNELLLLARHRENEVRETPEVDFERLQEAIDLYEQATEQDPSSALAHSRLARAWLYAGEVANAEPHIFRALSIDPDISEVQETLGNFYWLREPELAGQPLQRAIELNPSNADAIAAYAYWIWMHGIVDGPGELYRRALEVDPLTLNRYADLGNFLGNEARIEETEAIIERVAATFDSPASYRVIARLLELIGRNDEAIAWTLRARDADPDGDLYAEALAELLVDIGDTEAALELVPEPGVGLLLKMRRYEDFVDEAEFLFIDDPRDIHLRYLLAYAYNVTDRSADARRILEDVGIPEDVLIVARQVIDLEAKVSMAEALYGVGDRAGGRRVVDEWFDSSHTASPNWWIHHYNACLLALTGDIEAALTTLERITSSPRLPQMYLLRDSRCGRAGSIHPEIRRPGCR